MSVFILYARAWLGQAFRNIFRPHEPQHQPLLLEYCPGLQTLPHSPRTSVRRTASSTASSQSRTFIDRAKPEVIRAIEDSTFLELLYEHFNKNDTVDRTSITVEDRSQGSYHFCAILNAEGHGRFVIKIPFTGTADTWTDGDAHRLRSEAQTMIYVRRNAPKVPVPEVLAFDDTLNNPISAPYIIMRAVQGKPAQYLWVPEGPNGTACQRLNDAPGGERVKLRRNFLKSLANIMAELSHLQFDKIGALTLEGDDDAPQVGRFYLDFGKGSMEEVGAQDTAAEFLKHMVDESQPPPEEINEGLKGIYQVFNIIRNSTPFGPTYDDDGIELPESFVLAHPDLDLQNIFTDEVGNITGLIDWDGVITVPHCIGYASQPLFLRKDWTAGYDYRWDHPPWVLDRYRKWYFQYMEEALVSLNGEKGDAQYTPKSAMYNAIFFAFGYGGQNAPVLVDMIFKTIPFLRAMEKEDIFENLGSPEGWNSAEVMLTEELEQLFSP